MGAQKLLLPWESHTVLENLLTSWKQSQVSEMVLVTRRSEEEVVQRAKASGALVVTPEVDPPEMKISVAHGLQFVRDHFFPTDTDVWLLAPADMPRLSARVVDQLLREAASWKQQSILVPMIGEQRGHPVLFPWALADEVFSLSENEGINQLLKRHPVQMLPCDDPAILEDIDTPEDYQKARPQRP